MSLKTLPLLFINLGGEMLYILDQRLKAQNIPPEKAKKVMNDITGTMLNKRFMEELFKPQEQYSKKAMRTVFDRLAHASIMRLNPASMDKLYDLMTMAFKYQISLATRPKDILLITLNHMDAVRKFIDDTGSLQQQVDNVYRLLIENYGSIQPGEFMLIRQTLLNFFQDMHIRVSIFLKDKVQSSNGRFILPPNAHVPTGSDVPGTIRTFDANGKVAGSSNFNAGQFQPAEKEGSFGTDGDRVTPLGRNMYSVSRPVETKLPPTAQPVPNASSSKSLQSQSSVSNIPEPDLGANADPQATKQLDLLSKLLGKQSSKTDFRLNLFNTDEEEEQAAIMRPQTNSESTIVTIDASKKKENRKLSQIMGEMSVKESTEADDDLLDLMDKAQ